MPIGRIELGDDADNVRVDEQHHHVLVGYGDGALAVIGDPDQDGRHSSEGPSRRFSAR